MKILYVTSEAMPFAASGGLGDVMGALPREIKLQNDKIDTEVILPFYKSIPEEYKEKMKKVIDISFNLSWRKTGASIYMLDHEGVKYTFVENHNYFDREMLYGEFDDGERFAFFSTAVIEYIIATKNIPDIIHANDWQTALVVIYLKTKYGNNRLISRIKTLYTVHNIEYQGKYDRSILGDIFALEEKYLNTVEYDGKINLTKGALLLADKVGTVSPNYNNELCHDFFAFGLARMIREISHKTVGVLNGIDYGYFSPENGNDIYFPYTKRGYKTGKRKNKKALQGELMLEERDIPLLSMITRLVPGKGVDLVMRIIEEVLSEDIQFIILGVGDKEYEEYFKALEERYTNFRAIIKFDRAVSKKIYAASDIFVMPSKSEPCGLAQMIATSYGAVPVVRAVGGLYDSIKPYGTTGANGFTFDNYNAHELLYTLKRAISLYKNDTEWAKLVRGALGSDFSWKRSALEYIGIYNEMLAGNR